MQFAKLSLFGPLVCAQEVNLTSAVFEAPVTIEIAARDVVCERTRWESTATLGLRSERADKALRIALNTDVFSAPEQDLTTAGTYLTLVSRVIEAILAGLAILAVRNRVKR